ncbi:cAMP-dependent protein kinase catalytic subunit, putative, partial [Ixodes scapularis]
LQGVVTEPAEGNHTEANATMAAAVATAPAGRNNSTAGQQADPQVPPARMSAKDFIFGKLLGEGSFSMVYLAKEIRTNKEYAIKVCYKHHILREKKQRAIMREKQILRILSTRPHPFFIRLHSTFHDANKLYFVVTYAKNGELLPHIVKYGSFDADVTRFYTAEIICALEHLHGLGIVHRDLKPENILLDERMHIQITDFGSAKIIVRDYDGAKSFCLFTSLVVPETAEWRLFCCTDLWALGCIVYQMIAGLPPFRATNEYLTFQKIIKLDYEFPDGFHPVIRDLVENLLVLNPSERLGSAARGGYAQLRQHEFFSEVQWGRLPETDPPKMLPFLPGTSSNEELRSQYQGLFARRRMLLLTTGPHLYYVDPAAMVLKGEIPWSPELRPEPKNFKTFFVHTVGEMRRPLRPSGLKASSHRHASARTLTVSVYPGKAGLFARRRMLLLTTGPHLYYVDPAAMVLKGEIPWSPELRPEPKNFKTFFVHTPNRTYYLEDPEGYALAWCKAIDEVRKATYNQLDSAS